MCKFQKTNKTGSQQTYSFIESFEIDAVLGLSKFLTIILTLNFQFFTHCLCSQVTVARDVNDCNLHIYAPNNALAKLLNKKYLQNKCVKTAIIQ